MSSPESNHRPPLPPLPWHSDLDAALEEAWRRLVRGAADRRSPFHTMTVATTRPDGAPTARTMVLRGVDPARRVLRFHTDRRSPKLAELTADARVALLLYDPGARLQLRIDGRAAILAEGAVPDALWARTREQSRTCYRQPEGPGTPLPGPELAIPDAVDDAHGRDRFTAVEVTVDRLDWLFLNIGGHRRALFDWTGGDLSQGWIAP